MNKNDSRDIKELEQLYNNENLAIVSKEGIRFISDSINDVAFHPNIHGLYVVPVHNFYDIKMRNHNEEVMSRAREERAKLLDRF